MRMFEEPKPETGNAAALLSALFREFHDVPTGPVSQYISPSGLGCQVACAWKLVGAPTTPQKESFQSRCFADAGEDRHKRIQEFLSTTPYWVDIPQYIQEKGLNLEVIRQDGYETLLFSPEYQARFKCDGMLFIDGKYYVLEIKTERQAANNSRTEANEKHLKQGKAYTLIMHTDFIMWLYEGRDYLEQKPIVQYVSKEEKLAIDKYIKDIINNKEHPENLERDTKSCGYCLYKNYCKMYFKEREKRARLGLMKGE